MLKKLLLNLLFTLTACVPALADSGFVGPAIREGVRVLTTSGGTVYLTKADEPIQIASGTGGVTFVLPSGTSIPVGRKFEIRNESTEQAVIKNQNLVTLKTLLSGTSSHIVLAVSGVQAGNWSFVNDRIDFQQPSQISGAVQVANGGLGLTSAALGGIPYSPAAASYAQIPIGTTDQVLAVSSAGVPYWKANSSSFLAPTYASMSSASSPSVNNTSFLSNAGAGTSFTVTYPALSGYADGTILFFKKTDYTMAAVSGAGSFTKTLYTPNEGYMGQVVGSNIQILNHFTHHQFPNVTSLPSLISVSTGAKPVGGTTSTGVDVTSFVRRGKFLHVQINYKQTTAGTAGSGCYAITLPYSLEIDTTYTGTNNSFSSDTGASAWMKAVGICLMDNGSGTGGMLQSAFVMNSTMIRFGGLTGNMASSGCWGGSNNPFSTAAISVMCPDLKIPIVGWED